MTSSRSHDSTSTGLPPAQLAAEPGVTAPLRPAVHLPFGTPHRARSDDESGQIQSQLVLILIWLLFAVVGAMVAFAALLHPVHPDPTSTTPWSQSSLSNVILIVGPPSWARRVSKRTAPRQTAGAVAIGVVVLLAACTSRSAAWDGDCPAGRGPDSYYLVTIELSASERSPALIDDRLERVRRRAEVAADCEATFEVALLDGGRTSRLYRSQFSSALNTERARDLQIPTLAGLAMAEIRTKLAPVLGQPPPPTSDPGIVYRLLADRLAEQGPQARIEALILSDGVTDTPQLDLNRPIPASELPALTTQVAPDVDLGGQVAIEWPDIGRTADATGPPGDWVESLLALWTGVCQSRHAAPPCLVTSS